MISIVHPITGDPLPGFSVAGATAVRCPLGSIAECHTTASPTTVQRPSPRVAGAIFAVVDADGTSGTNPITVDGNGDLIDGQTAFVIAQAGLGAVFLYDGTQWRRLQAQRAWASSALEFAVDDAASASVAASIAAAIAAARIVCASDAASALAAWAAAGPTIASPTFTGGIIAENITGGRVVQVFMAQDFTGASSQEVTAYNMSEGNGAFDVLLSIDGAEHGRLKMSVNYECTAGVATIVGALELGTPEVSNPLVTALIDVDPVVTNRIRIMYTGVAGATHVSCKLRCQESA